MSQFVLIHDVVHVPFDASVDETHRCVFASVDKRKTTAPSARLTGKALAHACGRNQFDQSSPARRAVLSCPVWMSHAGRDQGLLDAEAFAALVSRT
jgi:hypothetical protein